MDEPANLIRMHSVAAVWSKKLREQLLGRNDTIVIISYPKSGRTWHRTVLGHYLAGLTGGDIVHSLDTRKFTRQHGFPIISYTHEGASFRSAIGPDHRLNGWGSTWKNRKIILLIRDPRDVLVSSFHHATYRSKCFEGTLSQFVRHPYTGVDKWIMAHRNWRNCFAKSRGVLIQTYEGMHQNHELALQRVLEFCEITPVQPELVRSSVRFGELDNMKMLEQTNFFAHKSMSNKPDASAAKVRSGRTESYKDEMSEVDQQYVRDRLEALDFPFKRELADRVV